jgi:hypothetical protein
LQWLFVFMTRIWLFATTLPSSIDILGRLIPIPKKASTTSVDTTRPISLLTTLYKLYAILVSPGRRQVLSKVVHALTTFG